MTLVFMDSWSVNSYNVVVCSLKGELESTIAELDESNCKLATLKAQRDAAKGAFFPVLVGNKHVSSDRARDKQKDLQDMESALKELLVSF